MNTKRIKQLQSLLEHPILIKKKENLLYLTGRSFMHGYLLVLPQSTKYSALSTGVVFLGDGLEKVEGIRSDFLKNVGLYIKRNQTLEVFGEFTYAEVKYIKYKNPKLKARVVVKHDPVDRLRTIKDGQELANIKKSMQIVEKVFEQVKRQLRREAWTEIKLAEFIKTAGLRLGAEDISFPPIVASGANASVPHHVPSKKRLKAGESIILDFGFKFKGFCSDFTRTVFLKKADKKLETAYNQVEKAYVKSLAEARSGARAENVYLAAVKILAEKKLEKYFIHSLGHGTGLEIHELPNLSPHSRDIIKNGMVFSIEPGVYLPGKGGVRIEDLVYLEKDEVKRFIAVSTALKDNII